MSIGYIEHNAQAQRPYRAKAHTVGESTDWHCMFLAHHKLNKVKYSIEPLHYHNVDPFQYHSLKPLQSHHVDPFAPTPSLMTLWRHLGFTPNTADVGFSSLFALTRCLRGLTYPTDHRRHAPHTLFLCPRVSRGMCGVAYQGSDSSRQSGVGHHACHRHGGKQCRQALHSHGQTDAPARLHVQPAWQTPGRQ